MKIFLILLQLTVLVSCATTSDFPISQRDPASPVEGDNCYAIMNNFIRSKPLEVRSQFETSLKQYQMLDSSERNFLARLVGWTRNVFPITYSDDIINTFDALLFVDYKHAFDALYSAAKNQIKLDQSGIANKYGRSFSNYKNASSYLEKESPPFTVETLKKVHGLMMEGGIDNIPPNAIGKIRTGDLIANVVTPIPQSSYDEAAKSIYLGVEGLVKDPATGKYSGRISYPTFKKMKPELEEKLKTINPGLYDEIKRFNNKGLGNQEQLTEKFVTALVEDLLSWFVKQKDDLGEIDTPQKLYDYTKIVATFQKTLISIHPFRDGNGRTVRQFAIYHAYDSIGFPKPRLVDPDDDLFSSVDAWTDSLIDGIRNTQRLYENAQRRMVQGYPLETTPELLIARFKEVEKVDLKTQKPERISVAAINRAVDISQVHTFFLLKLQEPNYAQRMKTEPGVAYNELLRDYYAFFKKSNLDYIHEKKGQERLSLNFIDTDFKTSFGDKSYKKVNLWNDKMARWYTDTIVWRGLSRRDVEIQESELLTMFKTVNVQFVSNGVAKKIHSGMNVQQLNSIIFKDFDKYNSDLLTDGLEKMAKDHSESGPMYGQSYGYSTSSNRTVGKAFAMGAMAIAPYGKHQEFQHLLKSRVLVGMKAAKKDVVLARLKQMRPAFSYKYPRQQEIMGIGASDPDSVMFVQLIDELGKVIKSYVRNPKMPNEIWVVKKEVSSFEEIAYLSENEIQKIILD